MAEWTNIEDWRAGQRARAPLGARIDALVETEQENWFLWVPVMFGAGIALYFAELREPSFLVLAALAAAMIVARRLARDTWLRLVLAAAVAISLGAVAASLRTHMVTAPRLAQNTGPVVVTGWVERIEPRITRGPRVTIRVVTLGTLPAEVTPRRVRLRLRDDQVSLKPGDMVRVRASLGPPPEPAAPGDFDFARLAYFRGLGGFGTALGAAERIEATMPRPWIVALQSPIEALRQAIRARIVAALPGETAEIATALITGERGGISEETNQAYRNAGLFHILSISGLHMVIMAGALFFVLRLGLAAVPRLALHHRIKAWAAAGAMAGAFAYLLISGAEFATVRAFVMIAIMFLAVILDRAALSLRNVALAALAILIVYPESLFDAGFQMSFAAVVGLVAAYDAMRRWREARDLGRDVPPNAFRRGMRFFGEIVASTIIASLVVAPFSIYHFHNTQLLAILANVFAIPVCNLIVMPAALGVIVTMPFGLEALPLLVMGHGVDAMTGVARSVGALPGAVTKVPAIPTLAFALIVAGGLWLLLWSQRWRLLGLAVIAAGLVVAPGRQRPDLLIARDGATVAVRMPDGKLSAVGVRGSSFDLTRWLEHDGDPRSVAEVADARAFTCDAIGCTARAAGKRIAIAMSPAAMREDCDSADIIIARVVAQPGCAVAARPEQLLLDPIALAAGGAHAVFVDAGGIRVETVRASRGSRPWSASPSPRPPETTSRTEGFTALFEQFRRTEQ